MTHVAVASLDPSQFAARGAVGAAVVAVLALVVLHFVQPELEVSRSMISQYAVGAQGWMMTLCFAAFAVASAALFITLLDSVRGPLAWLGLAALAAAMVGTAMGGAFPMDPTTTAPGAMSFAGRMHGVAFMVGVPGEILATLFLSLALRSNPAWTGLPLLWITAFVWVSLAIMAWALMGFMKDTSGPTVMGYFNRLFMVGYAVWVAVAAWPRLR